MPQSLVIQVGQCGNQIGSRFWERALEEHAMNNPKGIYDNSMATFFRNVEKKGRNRIVHPVGTGQSCIKGLEARGLMVDMEEGVINAFANSPFRELFSAEHQVITAVSGCGNNWAVGHHHYGTLYRDRLVDAIRKEAEACDALQSLFLVHSLGGGTGSGLGTRILALCADEFPEVYRFSTVVSPSLENDDVVTSPYNAVLALHQLNEHADAVLPIENQALFDICNRHGIPSEDHSSKPFGAMNDLAAQVMLDMTSSMRFPGSLNVDINEITMNLVPFPNVKYLLPSMAPLALLSKSKQLHQRSKPRIDQSFSDAFSRDSQLIKADPKASTYLACALMVRGQVQVSDIRRNIDRIQPQLKFAWWNQEGWKTGLCQVAPLNQPFSILSLANNSCIANSFSGIKSRFMKLYSRKANLHHYTEYMERSEFTESLASLNSVVAEYRKIEADTGPEVDDWESWARNLTSSLLSANRSGQHNKLS